MKYFKCLIAVLVLSLFLSTGVVNAAEEKKFVATVDKDGVQRIEILAGEYFFDPNYIVIKVNAPVEIKIKKEPSIVPHTFIIKAPDAGMDMHESLSSEPRIVRFTPAKTGKYSFYCDKKVLFFGSHREKGMEGTIEVTD